jgi:hypothetical protein
MICPSCGKASTLLQVCDESAAEIARLRAVNAELLKIARSFRCEVCAYPLEQPHPENVSCVNCAPFRRALARATGQEAQT